MRGPRRAALRLDARSGAILTVTREEADATARRDQRDAPQVREAALVEHDAPIEYRDKPLPACPRHARVELVGVTELMALVDEAASAVAAADDLRVTEGDPR